MNSKRSPCLGTLLYLIRKDTCDDADANDGNSSGDNDSGGDGSDEDD